MVEIAFVAESEITILRDLAEETFVETFEAQNSAKTIAVYIADAFAIDRVTAEYHEPRSQFYFARQEGAIAGYLKLNEDSAKTEQDMLAAMEIERIYARQSFHGKGIGKAMLEAAVTAAHNAQVDWLWLGVWEENPRAIAFYERNGFERFGRHVFMMGNEAQTDILMRRRV
ncbi:MAG: GNAT family N-acetyltransferase [Pseudomonadota bacterium]